MVKALAKFEPIVGDGRGEVVSTRLAGTMNFTGRAVLVMLKVHTGAQCDKISVQAPCRIALTSSIQHSIVGSHATTTVGSSFLAAIAAAGSLHCTEQLPVA